ncbi:hypothetical protein [Microbulbifer sp. NBRC 101763]|uniref:hypothetical protein n=1 Tax=Microbulbifer sp. NBRC 101763 TaxID=1113820 RepID=UPI00333FB450
MKKEKANRKGQLVMGMKIINSSLFSKGWLWFFLLLSSSVAATAVPGEKAPDFSVVDA